MSQVFKADGEEVPVTEVQAGPCYVTEVKTKMPLGGVAIQIGFDEVDKKKLNKPQLGHLKDLPVVKHLREFYFKDAATPPLERGAKITVEGFKTGDRVDVTGVSKGKGFQGVVRRHGFHGGPGSHGQKDNLRMPGSIGSKRQGPVAKGKRMAGHMGDTLTTIKNLEIVEVDPTNNLLKIKGALPGSRNAVVIIKTVLKN